MLSPKPALAGFLAILIVTISLLPQTVAGAESVPRAVLIIDGSGSMWGRIDKREKIVITRNLLADKIELLKGHVDLGIMSYGHRRRRDCRDIEMIVPIGPVDPPSYGKAIKRLLPRGKTPVASALQMAANALASAKPSKSQKPKSHIILVADGVENCRQDPCKTASILASTYPGLTIDVIGFAINDEDAEKLQCISSATKGQFHKADDSKGLARAIEMSFRHLGKTAAPRILAKKKKKKTPPGLYLSAGLASEGAPLQQDVNWRIYRAGESSKTSATPLNREAKATPFLSLPKGKYHIEARHEALIAEHDVELQAGAAVKLHLSFNVGVVTANARLGNEAPLSNDIIFSLYDASSGPAGPGTIIAHKQEENAVFYLPPGKYSLKARANETEVQRNFTLKAGERKNHTLLLEAGQISLTTSLAKDTPPLVDVQYAIYQRREKQDIEFVRTLDPSPNLVLPKGNYFVLARQGAASSYTKLVVRPGETEKLSLILNAGLLKLSSDLSNRSSDPDAQIAYTIEPIKPASPKTVKLSSDGTLMETDQSLPIRSFRNSFILPAGDYLVHALYGNSNAQATARVQVKAGEESQHKISMSAGRITLSLVFSAGDQPLPGVFWSILDPKGKQIASASSISPSLTLSRGSYQVVADYLGQSFRRDFMIENGDNKKLQLKLK